MSKICHLNEYITFRLPCIYQLHIYCRPCQNAIWILNISDTDASPTDSVSYMEVMHHKGYRICQYTNEYIQSGPGLEAGLRIVSLTARSRIQCAVSCSLDTQCFHMEYDSESCQLYYERKDLSNNVVTLYSRYDTVVQDYFVT